MIVIDAIITAYVRVRDRERAKLRKALAVKDAQILALHRDAERLSRKATDEANANEDLRIEIEMLTERMAAERRIREQGAYHAGDPPRPAVGAGRMHRMFGTNY